MFSAATIAYFRSCVLFCIAFWMFKDIDMITEQPLILLLGQSLGMNRGYIPTGTVSELLGVLFIVLGLSDLVALVSRNTQFIESIVPARLSFYFMFLGYVYFVPGIFHNDLVSTYCMAEIWMNLMLYNTLREEKQKRIKKFKDTLEKEYLKSQQDGKTSEFVEKYGHIDDI